jgi:hypothetical protein
MHRSLLAQVRRALPFRLSRVLGPCPHRACTDTPARRRSTRHRHPTATRQPQCTPRHPPHLPTRTHGRTHTPHDTAQTPPRAADRGAPETRRLQTSNVTVYAAHMPGVSRSRTSSTKINSIFCLPRPRRRIHPPVSRWLRATWRRCRGASRTGQASRSCRRLLRDESRESLAG